MYSPTLSAILSATSFSLIIFPLVPLSLPPCPASITTTSTAKSEGEKVLDEFSKVIANNSAVNPIFFTGLPMFKVFAITLHKIVNFSLKAKELIFTPAFVRYFLLLFILLTGFALTSFAQEKDVNVDDLPVPADTTQVSTDSLHVDGDLPVPSDSIANKSDTTKLTPKSDIETTINYTARDSIRASMDGKKIWLYGDAKITYGEIELEAEEILIDYGNNTLTAHGIRDSLGQRIGYPIFKNGAEL